MPESNRGIMPDPDPEWGDSLTWWWLEPHRAWWIRRAPVMRTYRLKSSHDWVLRRLRKSKPRVLARRSIKGAYDLAMLKTRWREGAPKVNRPKSGV